MHRKDKYVLAVDLGTSGPKTALISVFGQVLDCEFEETPLILTPGGGAEQDPQGWWDAVKSTIKKVIQKKLVPPEQIVAVSVTAQWAGTVAVDRDGRHLMNAVIWMDLRLSESLNRIFKGLIKLEGFPLGKIITWQRLTGGAPSKAGKDPVGHIHWIRENHPEIYRNTYKFLEPKDFINLCLTGKFAATYDSIILHWVTDNRNAANIVYSDKLIKMVGLERAKLPDLIQAMDILGPLKPQIARELGLPEGTPVIGGTPDVQSAGVGSGAVRDFEGHLYIGTSSWISAHVPFKKTDIPHNFGSFPSPIPGRYLILCEQVSAGKCLTWLRDNVLYHKDGLIQEEHVPDIFKVLDKVIAGVPAGANRVIFTPWLYGERSPAEDGLIRSSLFNLSLENTRADIVRAVFEGVAFNAKWLLAPVEKFMRRPFDYLNFIGGGANSDEWAQILADAMNRKIRQIEDPIYANARGAAYLAAMALGHLKLEEIPEHTQVKAEYTPNPNHRKVYDSMFKEFINHYKAQKAICARLNRSADYLGR